MPGSQRNDNFIDKTFTIVADALLRIIPTTGRGREAFIYYRDGMSAQSGGEYAEALRNYYEAMRLETDPYDRSYVLYNIGLIHAGSGEHARALEYYFQALERNSSLPQALNNIAVICHYRGEQAINQGDFETPEARSSRAALYWGQAILLAPDNYVEAQNWLGRTGRLGD
uniref:Photosystem I assembly protein Ycf3 n=1 Tax=Selaginella kraussiana TaxID=81964 RepID=A0A3Q9R494_9TRAC|nr:photosystem I assembly protein Ycf3 [Selaginella kraussiana]AZU95819.1 photosystem I assembly protein Ycf3 [Selaginella kraussiana]